MRHRYRVTDHARTLAEIRAALDQLRSKPAGARSDVIQIGAVKLTIENPPDSEPRSAADAEEYLSELEAVLDLANHIETARRS
jgi:hypothetical protein